MPVVYRLLLVIGLAAFVLPQMVSSGAKGSRVISKKWNSCDGYMKAVAKADFSNTEEPDLFLCHRYEFKNLFVYGHISFGSGDTYSLQLKTNKHGACQGPGEIGYDVNGGKKHGSAVGRFQCADGSQGGFAFELDFIEEHGVPARVGTIFGGIDDHASRNNEEDKISADFYIFDRNALRLSLGLE
ncbi:MAG: hypothetical protein GY952_06045 [Rhodobacteraceae bacterium]|nr:hypothetical protein [Paracoccaceae bacterium]